MLKHVHSTGGRSACSTPVMGSSGMGAGRHSRSPSCGAVAGLSLPSSSSSSSSSMMLMRSRRQSDISRCPTQLHEDDSDGRVRDRSQTVLMTIAANLLCNNNNNNGISGSSSSAKVCRSSSSRWRDCGDECQRGHGGRCSKSLPPPTTASRRVSCDVRGTVDHHVGGVGNKCNHNDQDNLSLGKAPTLSAASSFTSLNQLCNSPNSSFDSASTATSSSSLSPTSSPKTTVKIYTRCLRVDVEYKTLSISYQTTCRQVVQTLLNKCKMKHRDPNLFYLTMEVWVKSNGVPIRTVIVLEDDARPAELQQCHPRGESKFYLQIRNGGLVRIHDSCIMAGSQYKGLLLSDKTTSDEVIQLLLNCYSSSEPYSRFALYEYSPTTDYERKLHGDDCVLPLFLSWSSSSSSSCGSKEPGGRILRIKRIAAPDPPPRRAHDKLPWTRSLDFSSSPAPSPSRFNSTLSSSSTSSMSSSCSSSSGPASSYCNYENYFYI